MGPAAAIGATGATGGATTLQQLLAHQPLHTASRAAEKLHGGKHRDQSVLSDVAIPAVARPRTSGGVGARVSAALAAQSKMISAAVATPAYPAPTTEITGDLAYDILSPYVAQPLPWEKRPATAMMAPAAGVGRLPHQLQHQNASAPMSPAQSSAAQAAASAERRRKAAQ